MNQETARLYLTKVMNDYPELSDDGFSLHPDDKLFPKLRENLANQTEDFIHCCAWLEDVEKIKTINTQSDSTIYRNCVCRRANCSVSHGAFIAAALHSGFTMRIAAGNRCAFFNMSEQSLSEKSEYNRRY